MKRATQLRVRDERLPLQSDDRADILDSDARQRAEIRRLRKEVGRLRSKFCTCSGECDCGAFLSALAPKRRARPVEDLGGYPGDVLDPRYGKKRRARK